MSASGVITKKCYVRATRGNRLRAEHFLLRCPDRARGVDFATLDPVPVVQNRSIVGLAICAASFLLLFMPVLVRLSEDWANDDNYSHGFFIIPLALFFLWERRTAIARQESRPSNLGLAIVLGGFALLVAGLLGAELFVTRASLIVVLTGAVIFLFGWQMLRLVAFPLAFLVLMIPIPAIIFNQIAFPLQILASKFGETILQAANIPVLREGNIISLANTRLEVAEACSGIRSLISLLTLGIVYGYFTDSRPLVRTAIALSAIPIAIVSNGARVAGTGIAAHVYGPEAAQGFFHSFSGWLVFVVAFALMFLTARLFVWWRPNRTISAPTPAIAG